MIRRSFIQLPAALMAQNNQTVYPVGRDPVSVREFLSRLTYTRQEIDIYLDPAQPNWAKFDPELGYLRRDGIVVEGVDGYRSISRFRKTGERMTSNFADRACRLNCYGNSFTECCQSSDGETWEEYLAAHFGEPIRNFGIGGYGVYQAYRRMLREEATASAADYVILNVWGVDDHLRSTDVWRWLRFGEGWRKRPGHLWLTHCNPWAHIRLDLNTGRPVETENPYPTPQSLYQLCDKDHVYEAFHKDLSVQFLVARRKGSEFDLALLKTIADAFKMKADFRTPEATAESARLLELEYAMRTTNHVIEKAQAFARQSNKKLMVLLSYDGSEIARACQGMPRPDATFVDFLKQNHIRFMDARAKHAEDYKAFNLSPQDYVRRYYIGHYKPQGNHFFAFAVKDAIVEWLEPKPIAYREGVETIRRVV